MDAVYWRTCLSNPLKELTIHLTSVVSRGRRCTVKLLVRSSLKACGGPVEDGELCPGPS